MPDYRLTPAAQQDIDDVWDYTETRWGARQALIYTTLLRSAIERCSLHQYPTRSLDHIRPGYFRANAGSHAIIFRWNDEVLEVVRILHGRRDFNRHL